MKNDTLSGQGRYILSLFAYSALGARSLVNRNAVVEVLSCQGVKWDDMASTTLEYHGLGQDEQATGEHMNWLPSLCHLTHLLLVRVCSLSCLQTKSSNAATDWGPPRHEHSPVMRGCSLPCSFGGSPVDQPFTQTLQSHFLLPYQNGVDYSFRRRRGWR